MNLPNRKWLPHAVPDFVRSGAVFFITICGEPKRVNQFACNPPWSSIAAAASHYHNRGRWYCHLLLAMPDHLHLLASLPREEELKKIVTAWKHYLAGSVGIVWQRDFFDHRLRSHESFSEKAAYIRANPVRKGLAETVTDWAFVWSPPDIVATPIG